MQEKLIKCNFNNYSETEKSIISDLINSYFNELNSIKSKVKHLLFDLKSKEYNVVTKCKEICNLIKYMNDKFLIYGICYYLTNNQNKSYHYVTTKLRRDVLTMVDKIKGFDKSYISKTPVVVFNEELKLDITHNINDELLFDYVYNKHYMFKSLFHNLSEAINLHIDERINFIHTYLDFILNKNIKQNKIASM